MLPGLDGAGKRQPSLIATLPASAARSAIVGSALGSGRRQLGLLSLICVIYLVVSGGAYGIEDAVRLAGPRLALVLCLVVPLTLSLPAALMAAELNALMPVEGGFYFWVKEACGPFLGFAEAYLTLLYTAADMAIYPVMFSAYLSFLFPLGVAAQLAIGVGVVWLAGLLNSMGARPTGYTSIVLTALLLAPFVALVVLGFGHLVHWHPPAGRIFGPDFAAALGGGLTVVIWNFCGWENLSVVAGEIHDAPRAYARAIAIALPMVALGYLLPLGVSLSGASSGAKWETGWFAVEGFRMGGAMLGTALALGGAISSFAIFEAAMLWVSRLPFVLAREGYLPVWLAALQQKHETPGSSILVCCLMLTVLVPLGFTALVVFDVFFYMGALVLEMCALIRMRSIRPARDGLFTIGGGRAALYLVALAPTLTWFATFGLAIAQGGIRADFIIAVALAAMVYPAYVLCRSRWGGPGYSESAFDAIAVGPR